MTEQLQNGTRHPRHSAIADFRVDVQYLQWVTAKLSAKPDNRQSRLELYYGARRLSGHAADSGYHLLAVIADDLARLFETSTAITDKHLAAAEYYAKAMERIVAFRITGEGSDIARRFLDRFRAAVQSEAA